ncbi:MAG: hypothetical protein UV79_C0002G0013 [candidate division TM6 bacterium GW2011_GWF2_43_17]|nr:MAG: hypothetical protein UV79_C0002G0013 [candidate division TM6 bacterium GW2011_GWF2_43_17]
MEERYYAQSRSAVATFFSRVFGWMTLGVGLTTVAAFMVATSPAAIKMIFGSGLFLTLIILAQFALVIGLSAGINRMSFSTALGMFLLYSGLMGLTLSSVLLVYTSVSILSALAVAVGMFGAMALYGVVTKADLTPVGSFLYMSLFGLIIAMLINLFVHSAAFDLMTGIFGAIIFAGLTAFDMQRLKSFAVSAQSNGSEALDRLALIGALMLYLDFVNLFLSLLRVMGKQR